MFSFSVYSYCFIQILILIKQINISSGLAILIRIYLFLKEEKEDMLRRRTRRTTTKERKREKKILICHISTFDRFINLSKIGIEKSQKYLLFREWFHLFLKF